MLRNFSRLSRTIRRPMGQPTRQFGSHGGPADWWTSQNMRKHLLDIKGVVDPADAATAKFFGAFCTFWMAYHQYNMFCHQTHIEYHWDHVPDYPSNLRDPHAKMVNGPEEKASPAPKAIRLS